MGSMNLGDPDCSFTDDPRVGKRESPGGSQVLPKWQVNELISPLGGFATDIQKNQVFTNYIEVEILVREQPKHPN